MAKTVTFVTSQYQCDRIIEAARRVAEDSGTELIVVGVLDSEYELNPQAIDYLFNLSKSNKATMRLLFSNDKRSTMFGVIDQYESCNIVTGMPGSHQSILYDMWKQFPQKTFYTVDVTGEVIEVASNRYCTA